VQAHPVPLLFVEEADDDDCCTILKTRDKKQRALSLPSLPSPTFFGVAPYRMYAQAIQVLSLDFRSFSAIFSQHMVLAGIP